MVQLRSTNAGGGSPLTVLDGKSILVTGTVTVSQGRPQLRAENPNQIKVVDNSVPAAGSAKRPLK